MNASASLAGFAEFRRNRTLCGLTLSYALVWIITAIQPLDREDWLLENLMVLLALPAMAVALLLGAIHSRRRA